MTRKSAKTILFASLIAAMLLPFSAMEFADARTNGDDVKTKEDFKQDVKDWVRSQNGETKDEKISSLKTEYDELLLELIAKALVDADLQSVSDKETQALIHYAVTETIKDEYIKNKFEENENDALTNAVFNMLSIFGLQEAYATCPSTTNPSYKQENIDIVGGSYGGNYFNGDNDLYLVLYSDNSSTCERTYSLSFYDEDHPGHDAAYDALRWVLFNRTFDIETFAIKNNNQIIFDNTYSGSNDFDCLLWGGGCHLTHTKTYYPGSTVYVSNTWNHMMNTYDTNPSLTSVSVP